MGLRFFISPIRSFENVKCFHSSFSYSIYILFEKFIVFTTKTPTRCSNLTNSNFWNCITYCQHWHNDYKPSVTNNFYTFHLMIYTMRILINNLWYWFWLKISWIEKKEWTHYDKKKRKRMYEQNTWNTVLYLYSVYWRVHSSLIVEFDVLSVLNVDKPTKVS